MARNRPIFSPPRARRAVRTSPTNYPTAGRKFISRSISANTPEEYHLTIISMAANARIQTVALGLALIGAAVFHHLEPELADPVDAFYLSVMTLTTIGYGDISAPATPAGKAFFILHVFPARYLFLVDAELMKTLRLPRLTLSFMMHDGVVPCTGGY